MKKLIYGSVLVLMAGLMIMSCEKEDMNSEKEETKQEFANRAPKPVVKTLSSPGSFSAGIFGCWGSGRCYYDVIVYEEATSTIQNNGDGTVTSKDLLSEMNADNFSYYTTNTHANLTDPSELNEDDCLGLGLPIGTMLQPGLYPITISGDTAIVTYLHY